MVNNLNQSIDETIDEKLKSGLSTNYTAKELFKYSRIDNLNKNAPDLMINNLMAEKIHQPQKDNYNNEFYNYLNRSKLQKPRRRFNLLKLFKPGELLNSV